MCSVFCCPLVGVPAVWHALQVQSSWRQNEHRRAYMHAAAVRRFVWSSPVLFARPVLTRMPPTPSIPQSRKLASAAVFYGLMALMLYLFMTMDKDGKPGENNDGP